MTSRRKATKRAAARTAPADKKADFPVERTSFNDIDLRILVQDEDSKYNVLNMVLEDEERAEEGYQTVVRVLDLFREDTEFDLALPDAQEVAEAMRRHMLERDTQVLPKPNLLSDLADNERLGMPLGLREFLVHEEVPEILFRDFRDENDVIVHSIESFLTVHSSLKVYSGAPTDELGLPTDDEGAQGSDGPTSNGSSDSDGATGGFAVNINTAPPVVLKSLFDDREVNPAFWDEVIEFRNLEDEEAMQDEDGQRREPILDEYGDEVLELQYFGTLDDLDEIRGWGDFDGELQERIKERLTTKSASFSIIVTAMRKTAADLQDESALDPREAAKREETSPALRRVIRQIVFRHTVEEEVVVTPVVPWEALPTSPFEVVDYPDIVPMLQIPPLDFNTDLIGARVRGAGVRVTSTAAHSIELGVVAAMILPIAGHYAMRATTNNQRIFRWASTILLAASIPFSGSRAGYVGAAIVFITMMWAWNTRTRVNVGLLLLGGIAALQALTPGLLSTIKWLFLNLGVDDSATARTSDYEIVFDYIRSRPILGRGPGTWLPEEYIVLDNEWLYTAVTTGIVGVLAIVAVMLVALMQSGWVAHHGRTNETRHLAQALKAAILVGAITSATFDALSFAMFAGVWFIMFGMAAALWRIERDGTDTEIDPLVETDFSQVLVSRRLTDPSKGAPSVLQTLSDRVESIAAR